jgi:predicted GIY-YIG superfamily endonuclease
MDVLGKPWKCRSEHMFYVYVMQHKQNGRRWFGYTTDPVRRLAQHLAHPVKRMKADIPPGGSFHHTFSFKVVYEYSTQHAAEQCEARLIERFKTTENEFGYNDLRGKPSWSKKFWYLKRRGML